MTGPPPLIPSRAEHLRQRRDALTTEALAKKASACIRVVIGHPRECGVTLARVRGRRTYMLLIVEVDRQSINPTSVARSY